MEGIALLNIPSIYGGSNLWGESAALKKRKKATGQSLKDHECECSSSSMSSADLSFTIQNVGDRLIEVVGLENTIHVAQVKGGIQSGRRLAQCSSVVIRTHRTFPMQIDGEPWMQPPCKIVITPKNQVPMLMARNTTRKSALFAFLRR
jgi:diacylglycerol kinase (ATP)